jgi:hypothetical protein
VFQFWVDPFFSPPKARLLYALGLENELRVRHINGRIETSITGVSIYIQNHPI